MLAPDTATPAQFRWYLCGVGAWFASFGLQSVITTYLITTVLHLPGSQVAVAQGIVNLPAVFLLLVGGAVADHLDNRRLMIVLHTMAAVPAALLALTVASGALRYEWVIAYGLGMGTITAFMMPAREAMLGRVIVHDGEGAVQRAVTNTLVIQFLAQMVGMAATTFARLTGIPLLLALQAGIQLFGAVAVRNLASAPPRDPAEKHSLRVHVWRIVDGVREVGRSPALLPITIVTFSIGILLIGSFMVILPLIMREEYGGTIVQYALMSLAFWTGSISISFGVARLGNIRDRGRLVVLALVIGGSALMLFAVPTPLWLFYALVFVWGTGAGLMISMARTIVQENAPPAHLARVMSVYQLGFTGGMPIGAFLLHFVVPDHGVRSAALVPGGMMFVVLLVLLATTELWRIRSPERRVQPAIDALAPAD